MSERETLDLEQVTDDSPDSPPTTESSDSPPATYDFRYLKKAGLWAVVFSSTGLSAKYYRELFDKVWQNKADIEAKRAEALKIEVAADIHTIKTGLGFKPGINSQKMIADAQDTIDASSLVLEVPATAVCNLKAFRDESPKLDNACTVLAFNNKFQSERKAFLESTNYDTVAPYIPLNKLGEDTFPSLVTTGGIGLLALVSLSAIQTYLNVDKAITTYKEYRDKKLLSQNSLLLD